MFDLSTIGQYAEVLSEYGDEVRGVLKKWLIGIGAQRRQGVQPFLRGAVIVELLLFLLSGNPDSAFDVGVRDRDETPGLHIRSAGRCSCGLDAVFDPRSGNGAIREVSDRTSPRNIGMEIGGAFCHFYF